MRFVSRVQGAVRSLFGRDLEQKSIKLVDPQASEIFGYVPTVAGPSITAATALRVPAVHSAIVLISEALGALPAKVFAADDSGKRTTKDHPAYRLVHDEANDWTSAGQLRAALTADALLHDHGFAYANRVNGRVQEFIRLDPRTVTVKAHETTGEPVYEVQDGARKRTYPYTEILHISAPLGIAPIKAGREAIALSAVLEQHAGRLFAGGARPSGVLLKDKRAGSGDDGKTIIGNVRKAYKAWMNSGTGEPLILDDGWTYTSSAMTSTDAQFLENRRFQLEEIARVFRVPPHLLFDLSRATWSNAEEMFQSFLTLTLRSWLDAWEWAYARVLLTPDERAAGYYVEFVVDDLLTANAATRATTYAQYRSMGAMTANEVRAGLNLPSRDGGDILANPYTTSSTTTLTNTGEAA